MQKSGYSLVEVMIAVGILAIVAAGISSVTMLTSRIAYANIYENTANNVAQAYAEQIKSINYGEIKQALHNPSEYAIPTESLTLGTAVQSGDLKIDDPLIFGVPVQKEIVVDIEEDSDGNDTERKMKMSVLVTGNDLSESTDCWDAIEVTLDFTWDVYGRSNLDNKKGQIKLVKTNVSEY